MLGAGSRIGSSSERCCTGSYSRGTLIEPTCFLGTFEIPKDFMEKSAKLYYGENRRFRFPGKLEFKLFLV